MSLRSLVLTSTAALALSVSAHATTFDLTGSLGLTPTFSVTSGGITATFTSPTGNGFVVENTGGLLTFSTALEDDNFFGTDPLTITFSTPVSGTIKIPFAILDFYGTGDALTVVSNTGQTASFPGVSDGLALGEPEGIANFLGTAPVTSLTLSSPFAFAIGNVATTPEPTSLVLLGTGLAGLWMRRRRG